MRIGLPYQMRIELAKLLLIIKTLYIKYHPRCIYSNEGDILYKKILYYYLLYNIGDVYIDLVLFGITYCAGFTDYCNLDLSRISKFVLNLFSYF